MAHEIHNKSAKQKIFIFAMAALPLYAVKSDKYRCKD